MTSKSEHDPIENTWNISRFFVEYPHVSWVLLLGVVVWGWYGFTNMPQRKDPDIPVRVALATCPWPGATAQQVEQFVTRPIEAAIAQNKTIHPPTAADYGIRSISIPGAAYVYVQLVEGTDIRKQFSDVNLKLNELNDQLPQGAGPISFQSDFGDTAAIMLTVASPRADQVEIDLRARDIESAIRTAREHRKYDKGDVPVDIIYSFPRSISPTILTNTTEMLELEAQDQGVARRPQIISGTGFIVMDGIAGKDDVNINRFTEAFVAEHFQRSDLPPDVWPPIMVHDPAEVRAKLTDVAGDKYTYADLDNFSDLIARTVEGAPETSK